jgi:hypothetical protein
MPAKHYYSRHYLNASSSSLPKVELP